MIQWTRAGSTELLAPGAVVPTAHLAKTHHPRCDQSQTRSGFTHNDEMYFTRSVAIRRRRAEMVTGPAAATLGFRRGVHAPMVAIGHGHTKKITSPMPQDPPMPLSVGA